MSAMTARSPSAFMLSATLHALFAAVMLYTAYALKDEVIDKGKVFELVAGEGDNYAATEAPALGTPGGVKFDMPAAPAAAPASVFTPPEPIAPPTPEPVAPAPVEAVPPPKVEPKQKPEPSPVVKAETKPTTKADPAVPNFVKSIKRVQVRIDSKQRAQREKEAKAAALAAKNAEIAAKKAELIAQAKAGGGQSKIAKIDAEGIAKGVLGGSTNNKTGGAGGTALSREEQDLMGTYFALIKQRLREVMKPVEGDDNIVAKVEFHISPAGTFSQVHIIKSSGSAEYDQAVLDAFREVGSVRRGQDDQGELVPSLSIRKKDLD